MTSRALLSRIKNIDPGYVAVAGMAIGCVIMLYGSFQPAAAGQYNSTATLVGAAVGTAGSLVAATIVGLAAPAISGGKRLFLAFSKLLHPEENNHASEDEPRQRSKAQMYLAANQHLFYDDATVDQAWRSACQQGLLSRGDRVQFIDGSELRRQPADGYIEATGATQKPAKVAQSGEPTMDY